MKNRSLFILLFALSLASCDLNTANEEFLLTSKDIPKTEVCDCFKPLTVGYHDLINGLVSSYGANMQLLSDQITSTNNVRGFYTVAQEPRLPLPNPEGNVVENNIKAPYSSFNASISTANRYIRNIVIHSNTIYNTEGVDITSSVLSKAYLLRGIARGYLGLIYDKAFYVDEFYDYSGDLIIADYSTLIDSALSDLDKAIKLTTKPTDIRYSEFTFPFDNIPGGNENWNESDLHVIANSFAARILASKARTFEEAQQTDWEQVLTYTKGAISDNTRLNVFSLSNIGSAGELANYFVDWTTFIVNGDVNTGSGYLPVDLKVIHLLDPNYPTEYPENAIEDTLLTLPKATSTDPRLAAYYNYTQNKGFLNLERNRALFSTYLNKRMYGGNDWWVAENKIVLFTKAEIDYLKAEAHFMLGNKSMAASILNESPAGIGRTELDFSLPALRAGYIDENSISGNHFFSGTESKTEFQLALLREYSVELEGLAGIGLQWFFMRRHDLLQEGTATMYPIPASEVIHYGIPNYTFGGVENAGQVGTASGANSWKNLRDKIIN